MSYLKYLSILALSVNFLFATVYETGERGTANWVVYDNKPAGATVESTLSADEQGNRIGLIRFTGDGRRNAYMIGAKKGDGAWKNRTEFTLKWKMNFSEKFKVSVYAKTKKGKRVFIYDYKNRSKGLYKKRYIRIGLDLKGKKGWQSIVRDLEADLAKYEPDNRLLEVDALKVQGSGMIRDIELTSESEVDIELNNELETDKREALNQARYLCSLEDSGSRVICSEESGEENIIYYLEAKDSSYENKVYRIDTKKSSVKVICKPKEFYDIQGIHTIKNTPYISVSDTDYTARGHDYLYYKGQEVFSESSGAFSIEVSNIRGSDDGKQLLYDLFTYDGELSGDPQETYVYDISNPEIMKFVKKIKIKK